MAKIVKLKQNNTSVYPQTIGEAVAVNNTTLVETLNSKVDKVYGKGLSTEDYTTKEKQKLSQLTTDWMGTQAEYDALESYDSNRKYYII